MNYSTLRNQVLDDLIIGPNGNHSARLWRVAENVRGHALVEAEDDRLLHLMSRIGVLCRGLAADLRAGHTSSVEAAKVLDQMADLGELSFHQWLGGDDLKSTT